MMILPCWVNAHRAESIHQCVNDCATVSIWQDGGMTPPMPAAEDTHPGVRIVDDIDTLKALADPVRVSILQVMMGRTGRGLHGWTAKELAAELGEPQTKLYRHLKHLEERGLLRVAETRLVSGIAEQRYVAAQAELQLSRDLLGGDPEAGSTSAAAFDAAIDSFRRRFAAGVRSGRVDVNAEAVPGNEFLRPLMLLGDLRLRADRAARFRQGLMELIAEFLEESDDDGDVPLNVLLAIYSAEDGGVASA
jgi:DNA-binding transcriptional ArsR family regulator